MSSTQAPPAAAHVAHDDHHDHPAHLAHHFDDEEQQFDAGKLGIWLFLVTEILFFSGLFCAYSIWRHEHPEVFLYSHYYLSTFWGALNTCVLLISSLTAAWAVRTAQLGDNRKTALLLGLTILCAFGFLGIKSIEYGGKFAHGTGPGKFFNPHPEHMIVTAENYTVLVGHAGHMAEGRLAEMQAEHPEEFDALFHESREHVLEEALAAKAASMSTEKDPVTVADLSDAVRAEVEGAIDADHAAHGHGFEAHAAPEAHVPGAHGHEGDVHAADAHESSAEVEHSRIEKAMLHHESEVVLSEYEERPASVRTFFSIYFAMTGLHGIHVVAGIIAIGWVMRRAMRGEFNPGYFGAVDYVALYWHLVDLIWIYLFPLLYLIH
ncbi:cytochrome c oxidase subunit 3 [Engelhardtia mirabilis]|uniref:Cytochrome c oxidase subunit 3 n=1 Tax=Engelhardtia mirabilis TaxID=2528011 RepID=A0A518BH38_9BACT|nr:Cytochrome c oxidase subunit 3 [Planctomycetes bacterium Pla133]QDV00602.1 Cytochrome c oxidase subunit 3 [Planctomycetes bacterium Pla86]